MLFSKKITDITYEDVTRFADHQIPEGINIDYKREFPADLEKTISAFANTHGGIIIIGIADKDSKPLLPAIGIPHADKLQERVTQICVNAITPPVIPEVQVCPSVKGNTFVVIRIPESDMAPHAINNREDIYIRTVNIAKLEKRADAEKIEWLLGKRKKSVEFRDHIILRAQSHFNALVEDFKKRQKIPKDFKFRCDMTYTLVPMYPYAPLCSPQHLKGSIQSWRSVNAGASFPNTDTASISSVEGGVNLFFYNERNRYLLYDEVNQHGLIYSFEDMIHTEIEKNSDGSEIQKDYLYEARVIARLSAFFRYATQMYTALGYWGSLSFTISIQDLQGITYVPFSMAGRYSFGDDQKYVSTTPEPFTYQTSVSEIQDNERLHQLIVAILKDFDWALNHEIHEAPVRSRLKEYDAKPTH